MLVADALVDRLREWGIIRIFGFSGDGVDPILTALNRSDGAVELVTARHEETAAFMATAHAKWTGGIGCCMATHGPGAIHLLNGLYDAKLDKMPVVAIVAQQHRSVLGSGYQQEIDARVLFKDVCSQFVGEVHLAEQLHLVVDTAVRTARATRSPTCIIVPHDVQRLEMPESVPHSHGMIQTAAGSVPPTVQPDEDAVTSAAALLSAGRRVAVLVGRGAAGAVDEITAIADLLGAGVATSLLGKPIIPDDLPFVTGVMGHLGTTASEFLMSGCDTLLMVGTNEPYTEFLPAPGQARAVQIDIDGRNLGNRYPTEINIVGDAATTLRRLIPSIEAQDNSAWRRDVEDATTRWWATAARRAARPAEPVNPQRVAHELSLRLPAATRLAVDVGSATYWYARHVRIRNGIRAHLSSTLSSMGCSLPYAIAAKCADPAGLVVAFTGDGAFQMTGVNELITIADRWRRWADPRLPIIVLDNGDLNEVTWEQREMEGDPKFAVSQAVPPFDYAGYADLLGLIGIRVDRPDDVGAALDTALGADRPVLIQVVVDPAVPLLPPRLDDALREKMLAGLEQEHTAPAERARRMLLEELSDQQ